MYSFREKLARFMAGRYGIDTLYTVLLAVCVILAIVNMFGALMDNLDFNACSGGMGHIPRHEPELL